MAKRIVKRNQTKLWTKLASVFVASVVAYFAIDYVFQWHRKAKVLDDNDFNQIAAAPESHQSFFNETLNQILIVRVPGTPGHRKVNLVSIFVGVNWNNL